jgi:tetratricopeptide (TPR) repeat protein
LIRADSVNEGPPTDLQKELLELESRLAEEPSNHTLWCTVTLTLAAIYVSGKNNEIRGVDSNIDLQPFGERAIQAARRVVEVCPHDHYSFTNLASYLDLWPYLEKVLEWSRFDVAKQIAKAPELRASAMVSQEAFDLYERALEVDPNDCNFLSLMIPFCLHHRKYRRAAELTDHGVSFGGMDAFHASLYEAKIERAKGNYDVAIEQFRKLFGPHPESSDYECDLIETYRLAGRYEDMLSLAKATIKKCPITPNAYCFLAKFYEAQGRAEEAAKANDMYCNLIYENLKAQWLEPSPQTPLP